jgi:hypothetical protein
MKTDAELLREVLMFVHIPAQIAALERAIVWAKAHDKQDPRIRQLLEKSRRFDARMWAGE